MNPTLEEVQRLGPWVYEHRRCGKRTEIDVMEMHTVFTDPYRTPHTFCAACGKHFHDRELTWADSGENLYEYVKRVRARKSLAFKVWRLVVVPVAFCGAGAAIDWFASRDAFGVSLGAAAGAVFGWVRGEMLPGPFNC